MKIFLGCCALFFWSSLGFCQEIYRLKIIDEESKEVLSGATVLIKEIQLGAVSNDEGISVFENVPLGKFTLEIRFLGYETQRIKRTFSID